MQNRKGFTLIELLVVLAILCIIVMLVVRGCGGNGFYGTKGSGLFRCIKTYTTVNGESTDKRVDLQARDGTITTMNCNDDLFAGVQNSGTLYAQFEPNKWYNVSYVGYRRDDWMSVFPLVTGVSPAPDPTQ